MSAPYPDMLPLYLHSATSTGAGGGDEDPHRNPYRLKSSHEADVPGDQKPYQEERETDQSAQTKRIKRNYPADPGPFGPCPVCQRSFKSSKALHGHMRCHPDRAWRGMVPPEQCDPHVRGANKTGAASANAGEASGSSSGIEWPFRCRDCGADFRTKQALGGHRASHKSKKGCYMLAREGLARLLRGASINNNNNNNNINNNINNNNNNSNNNAGMRNNGGGGNGRDGSRQGSRIMDLNLPPPEEEEDEEDDHA